MKIILKQLQKDVLHEAAKKLRLHITANKNYSIFYQRKGGKYGIIVQKS